MGVHAAHRLDGGGVGGVSDWALRPVEVRRRRLEKQRSNRHRLSNCSHSDKQSSKGIQGSLVSPVEKCS